MVLAGADRGDPDSMGRFRMTPSLLGGLQMIVETERI
jgi:hypothetical protein